MSYSRLFLGHEICTCSFYKYQICINQNHTEHCAHFSADWWNKYYIEPSSASKRLQSSAIVCSALTLQCSFSLLRSLKSSQSIMVVAKLSKDSWRGHCGRCMHNAVRQQRLATLWLTRQSGEHALWLSCDNAGTERGQTSADLVGRTAFSVFAAFHLCFRDRLRPPRGGIWGRGGKKDESLKKNTKAQPL